MLLYSHYVIIYYDCQVKILLNYKRPPFPIDISLLICYAKQLIERSFTLTYLWINPVSERMISAAALEKLLKKHDLTRVVCQESWGEIVLRKYRELLEHADGTFADARCPAAVSLVHSLQPEIRIADIEPILIHCARELAERPDLANGEKIITTPCRILADMGNKLELKDTHFVPWNRFLAALGEPMEPAPDASPIPPGFFKDLPFSVVSQSGRPAIESYVTGNDWKNAKLIELLYCVQGCHRGDGVR
jgi:hypothetical protein